MIEENVHMIEENVHKSADDFFYAYFKDESVWRLSFENVCKDIEEFEKSCEDEDKFPRPITRDMAYEWFGDNCNMITGWELESAPPCDGPNFDLLRSVGPQHPMKILTGTRKMSEDRAKREKTIDAFVPVLGDRVFTNAVGSTETEVAVNLSFIDLSDDEEKLVDVRPCKIVVDLS